MSSYHAKELVADYPPARPTHYGHYYHLQDINEKFKSHLDTMNYSEFIRQSNSPSLKTHRFVTKDGFPPPQCHICQPFFT
jgi:hypothetical protein